MMVDTQLKPEAVKRIREELLKRFGGHYRCPMCQGESFTFDPQNWIHLS